jgi:hypothetical protein
LRRSEKILSDCEGSDCNRLMTTVLQFGSKPTPRRRQLDPTLKEFLDVVVIPALVKAYVLENARENRLAIAPGDMTHSASQDSCSIEGVP